jgi:endonuclease YncB( thermonuclease family)
MPVLTPASTTPRSSNPERAPRRLIRPLGGLALLILAAVAAWGVLCWAKPAPHGIQYSVLDGDTLARRPTNCWWHRLGIACISERLRLYGVDAFEAKQTCRDAAGTSWPCGEVATARMRELVAMPDFACHVDHDFIDRHAREFAICTARGVDVGATLVREGLAFSYGRGAQYVAAEAEAKAQHRGAWAGSFVRPQYFREGARD